MSDAVLAAMIAAGATLITSLLQLKASFKREVAARAQAAARVQGERRRTRGPLLLITIMLLGAAVGGFSLDQWLMERERAQASGMQHELQSRLSAADEVLQTRAQARDEIEAGVLRRQGAEGAEALTTVAACKAPGAAPAALGATLAAADGGPACAESDAVQVLVCAPIPAHASVVSVELYSRFADADTSWSAARSLAGQELEQSRFSEKPVEVAGDGPAKHICHGFANWSTQHARVARMIVKYTL